MSIRGVLCRRPARTQPADAGPCACTAQRLCLAHWATLTPRQRRIEAARLGLTYGAWSRS